MAVPTITAMAELNSTLPRVTREATWCEEKRTRNDTSAARATRKIMPLTTAAMNAAPIPARQVLTALRVDLGA